VSFRGDRIARRGRTARPLLQRGRPGCVSASGRAGDGGGVTARRQRPAPVRSHAKAAGRAAAHSGEPPLLPRPPTARHPSNRLAQHSCVPPRPLHEPGQGRTARRAEGVPFTDSKETPHRTRLPDCPHGLGLAGGPSPTPACAGRPVAQLTHHATAFPGSCRSWFHDSAMCLPAPGRQGSGRLLAGSLIPDRTPWLVIGSSSKRGMTCR
jgi:hypothetical protein